MAQRLIPGFGFANGSTGERVRMVPGWGFVNAPESAGGATVFIPIVGRGPGMALAGKGGLAGRGSK